MNFGHPQAFGEFMNKKLLLGGIALLSIGMCFGAAFFHWNCSRLHNCGSPLGFLDAGAAVPDGTRLKAAMVAMPELVPAAASGGTEEHLIKLQETVLRDIEASNTKTKEMLDFALLAVGFVGSLVLAIFGYFGWSTAQDLKDQKTKGEQLIEDLEARQTDAANALAKFNAAQSEISANILSAMAPKLGQIANYGMKIAEFAGSEWRSMSFEDRIRNCVEASEALAAADLGEEAFAALSFIRARQGDALLSAGDYVSAATVLEEACKCNVRKKPDRPYNLACAYSQLTKLQGTSKDIYTAKAVDQLGLCLSLCTSDPVGSTISRAYFLRKIRENDPEFSDKDLDPIRGADKFKAFVAAQ